MEVASAPDIHVLSAELVAENAVKVTYSTTGNVGPFGAAMYSSVDGVAYNAADLVTTSLVTPNTPGGQATHSIPIPTTWVPDPTKHHLVIIADPPSEGKPNGEIVEADENNNVTSIMLPNIRVDLATTNDSRQVQFTYTVTGAAPASVKFSAYRSSRSDFLPSEINTSAGGTEIHLADRLVEITSQGTFSSLIVSDLPIDPRYPYIHVVADPHDQIPEIDESDNAQHFRKRVIGIVTHGFTPPIPLFATAGQVKLVQTYVHGMSSRGYDRSIPFYWLSESRALQGGVTIQQASRMALQLRGEILRMSNLFPNDVLDIHLIGHSRGAVVVSHALQSLQTDTLVGGLVRQGFSQLTLLDPHPARNGWENAFSRIPLPARIAPHQTAVYQTYVLFQSIAQDPDPIIPMTTDRAEVFFQQTSWLLSGGAYSAFGLNLWGQDGNTILNLSGRPLWRNQNLTGLGVNHSTITDRYLWAFFVF